MLCGHFPSGISSLPHEVIGRSATIYSRWRQCPHQPSHLTMVTAVKALHMLGSMAQAWDDGMMTQPRVDMPQFNLPSSSVAALRWENSQTGLERGKQMAAGGPPRHLQYPQLISLCRQGRYLPLSLPLLLLPHANIPSTSAVPPASLAPSARPPPHRSRESLRVSYLLPLPLRLGSGSFFNLPTTNTQGQGPLCPGPAPFHNFSLP